MMYVVKNLQETPAGNLECEILNGETWSDFLMSPNDRYKLSEESEWQGVKPCPQVEKDANQLGLLQDEAVAVMASAILKECRSGTGKLYFSNIESAAMYTSAIQKDAEIRARAEELMLWSFAIDTYALSVVFDIDEGGEVPTIEEFIAGLPTI